WQESGALPDRMWHRHSCLCDIGRAVGGEGAAAPPGTDKSVCATLVPAFRGSHGWHQTGVSVLHRQRRLGVAVCATGSRRTNSRTNVAQTLLSVPVYRL